MKIYQINNSNLDITHSLSIDPGINTSGLCLLEYFTSKITTKTYYEKNLTQTIYPIIFKSSQCMINNYLTFCDEYSINFNTCELNIEYSFTQGTFAPGLFTEITSTVNAFLAKGINSINFLPAKVTGHFLQTNAKINEKLIKAWFKEFLPTLITNSPHSRDAFMLSMYMNFEFYKNLFNLEEIKPPEIELINLGSYNNYYTNKFKGNSNG